MTILYLITLYGYDKDGSMKFADIRLYLSERHIAQSEDGVGSVQDNTPLYCQQESIIALNQ